MPRKLSSIFRKIFAWQDSITEICTAIWSFLQPRIIDDNLSEDDALTIKTLRTVANDYAPDLINPVRKYSSEDELKDAAQKALDCVKTSEYLSSIESKY